MNPPAASCGKKHVLALPGPAGGLGKGKSEGLQPRAWATLHLLLQVYKALLDGVQPTAVKEVHLGDNLDVHASFMQVSNGGLEHSSRL